MLKDDRRIQDADEYDNDRNRSAGIVFYKLGGRFEKGQLDLSLDRL